MKKLIKPSGKFIHAQIIALLVIYEETKANQYKESIEAFGTDTWLLTMRFNLDIPTEFKTLPNYIAAEEIKNSPLYETLREEDGTESSSEEKEEE